MAVNNKGLEEWWPWYERILRAFNYDREEDQRAAHILNELLGPKALVREAAERIIRKRQILVFGAGPSLEEDLKKIVEDDIWRHFVIVTADGATSALLEIVGRIPDIVVTDLDGDMEDIISSERRGSLIVVHAHGDNIPSLRQYVPMFSEAMGTTQARPIGRIYNFGGFTDGDRAVFLSAAQGAQMVVLAGMDFGVEIGRYSKKVSKSVEAKRLKLWFGKRLLEWLSSKTPIKLFNFTSGGIEIEGFKRIDSLSFLR